MKIKRLLSLLLVSALLLTVVGCRKTFTFDSNRDVVVTQNVYVEDTPATSSTASATSSNAGGQTSSTASSEKSDSTPAAPVKKQAEKKLSGKLSVQIFINENGVGEAAWTEILDEFEKANPDLALTTYIGTNVNSQLANTWLSGQNTPDLVLIDGKGLSETSLCASGSFLDLTDWYRNATVYGQNKRICDVVTTAALERYNGKLYKMPLMLNCYGLWYDQNLYRQQGIQIHRNFSEMLSNATAQKSAGTSALTYPGMYSNYLVWGTVMPAVAAYGQGFFDEISAGKNPKIYQDERLRSVLENLHSLGAAGYVSASATQDHLGAQSDWLNHRAALVSSGIWLEAEMKKSIPGVFDMRFTTAGLNLSGQKPGAVLMGVGVAISSHSKNAENAKTLVRYLYREDSLKKLALSYGYMTAAKQKLPVSAYKGSAKQIMQYLQGKDVNIVYKTRDWGNLGETFNSVANRIAQGKLSAADGCKELATAAGKNK
ncbi:MAG: extracellular solute-binding protein [Clostridia bacterium]|nr:extracellular solute-binding protein [Clostridia bacterium]